MKIFPGSRIILELRAEFSEENVASKIKEIVLDNQDIEDIHEVSIYEIGKLIDISVHILLNKYLQLAETEILTKNIEEELKIKIPFFEASIST